MGKLGAIGRLNVKALEEIASAVREIKHGCVELIVQDSRVIQINKTEKIRLDKLDKNNKS